MLIIGLRSINKPIPIASFEHSRFCIDRAIPNKPMHTLSTMNMNSTGGSPMASHSFAKEPAFGRSDQRRDGTSAILHSRRDDDRRPLSMPHSMRQLANPECSTLLPVFIVGAHNESIS